MADKAIAELVAASQITATDMFVLEQNGTAKKLTGQILLNWLTAAADGHGGIQSIEKLSTIGLADTYRITLADTTVFDFVVTNGRGIRSITKTSTSGLVDTYTISYNDGTTSTFTVTNGEKGDKGDNAYIWVKFASQQPTASSNSFGDVPDDWIGIYFGGLAEAPTDWQQYIWYKIKGEKGDTGDPATLVSATVTYQAGDTGTIIPSGAWTESIPMVAQGKYLWTKIVQQFNTGSPITSYTVSRMGLDGLGSVVSVAGVSPDESGNVPLTAADIRALSISGGYMEGLINMNGQTLSGLNAPTANDQAANMGYVNEQVKKAAPRNLLDNSDFANPVAQAGHNGSHGSIAYTIDRWIGQNITATQGADFLYLTTNQAYGHIKQIVAGVAGKTLTCAAKFGDGGKAAIYIYDRAITTKYAEATNISGIGLTTVTVPEDVDEIAVLLYPSRGEIGSGRVYWAALYEGEYTAETLPEYQPKGYSVELAECQRHYLHHDTWTRWSCAVVTNKNYLVIRIPTPSTMRTTPSIVANSNGTEISIDSWYALDVSVMSVSFHPGEAILYAAISKFPDLNLEVGTTYLVNRLPSLSADL